MYSVSALGVVERIINVRYYYYKKVSSLEITGHATVFGDSNPHCDIHFEALPTGSASETAMSPLYGPRESSLSRYDHAGLSAWRWEC